MIIGVCAVALLIILLWIEVALFAPAPASPPRHALQEKSPVVLPAADDTDQLSSFDRRAYIATWERLAITAEIALAPSWADLWRESAETDALLNSGVLAIADWLPARPGVLCAA